MHQLHHILIVDDARDIREPLAQYLKKNGFRATMAANAKEARQHLKETKFELVILDIMMPGEDGLQLCQWVSNNDGPPVILLTAVADDVSKVVGLEIGAEDYLTKPFNPRELLARIKIILRRFPKEDDTVTPIQRKFAGMLHDPFITKSHAITSYIRNDDVIWHQVVVISSLYEMVYICLSSVLLSMTVSPITNTEYAYCGSHRP